MTFGRLVLCSFLLMGALVLSACGKDAASNSCTTDNDCALGTVCSADSLCISAACEFCTETQVCYKPTADAAGSCSKPECVADADCEGGSCSNGLCGGGGCTTDDDCGADEECNLAGTCVSKMGGGDCAENVDCPNGQFCNADSACEDGCRENNECPQGQVCGNGACACGPGTCEAGKVCLDTGNCGDPTDCAQVVCDPATEVCDPATFACVLACTDMSCNANEVCNPNTGFCEVSNCPNEDPLQCDGNAQRPLWDPIKCFCSECVVDTDCVGAGETCNAAGECFVCTQTCNPQIPGTCGAGTPYCINDCCRECVGAADCQAGEICLDGGCAPPPNCQVDPTICPAGYTCNPNTNQCEPPNNNACDPANPASCPNGGFCDPNSMTCTNPFGGGDCGFCAGMPGACVCGAPGVMCDDSFGIISYCPCDINPLDPIPCPTGQQCIPFVNACIPN